PRRPAPQIPLSGEITVATYNVHRWTGLNGRSRPDPARAGFVISELGADLISLQEVLRPDRGDDPLEALAEALGLHVVFAASPVLALDRIYARGLTMIAIEAHDSRAARRASDHLPVVALVKLDGSRPQLGA